MKVRPLGARCAASAPRGAWMRFACCISSWACASRALACPDCELGRAARAAVFDDAFFAQLGLVLLPLVLIGMIAAGLYRVGMSPRRRGRS